MSKSKYFKLLWLVSMACLTVAYSFPEAASVTAAILGTSPLLLAGIADLKNKDWEYFHE